MDSLKNPDGFVGVMKNTKSGRETGAGMTGGGVGKKVRLSWRGKAKLGKTGVEEEEGEVVRETNRRLREERWKFFLLSAAFILQSKETGNRSTPRLFSLRCNWYDSRQMISSETSAKMGLRVRTSG